MRPMPGWTKSRRSAAPAVGAAIGISSFSAEVGSGLAIAIIIAIRAHLHHANPRKWSVAGAWVRVISERFSARPCASGGRESAYPSLSASEGSGRLTDDFVHDAAGHIGQTEVAAIVAVRQAGVL